MAAAQHVFSRLPVSLQNELDMSGLGNDAETIRFFAHLGESMMGAQEKINKIMSDKNHAYWNRWSPGHEEAVAEVARLFAIVHGSRPVA